MPLILLKVRLTLYVFFKEKNADLRTPSVVFFSLDPPCVQTDNSALSCWVRDSKRSVSTAKKSAI